MALFDLAATICSRFGGRRDLFAVPSSGIDRRPTAGIPALCRRMPPCFFANVPYHEKGQEGANDGIALLTMGT
jgi:hypothetical protein